MDARKEYTREYLEENIVGKIQGITIPVNITVSGRHRIFEFGELTRIIESATTLAQTQCGCRTDMNNCDYPREGCIALDEHAEMWIEKEIGHRISKEDALEALQNGVEHGLVNVAYVRDRGKADVICTCCECCCDSLGAMLRFGYSDQVLDSRMIALQDEDACTDCGLCVEACQFKARSMEDGKLVFDDGKCAGCGLCVRVCESDAISMVEREKGGSEVPFP
ncbi:MAG: 4Fe-4S dicluster domain-containing protein [Thermoplasmata archaeon]|nr:4Fe-4S dicluster domain-containing protein [Thermoplasmata archaeon]NIS14025.1 4Fe-4S dicluster domain-containing protein [Thermoplasmata archaeon]NIS21857.1 4Fe-4S dicluster domain-containing protein [Thermoplasmata archaeon]NIU50892.1 4Fe-4S dicluster domain-containing protein [Thermoplasmata archaeon]NIV80608.1 4Fe-4S dicluster domain-containing protein [Thermoplasmata archaeon]